MWNVPWIVSPVDVISVTLPACTCCRKNVYDTVVRDGLSATDAKIQFASNASRISHHMRRVSFRQSGGFGC